MNKDQPTFIMLVGLPTVGKSYVEPSITEGFDFVYFINTENNNFTITNKQGI